MRDATTRRVVVFFQPENYKHGKSSGVKKKTDGFEWHPVYEKMIIKLKELHLKKMFKSKKIIKQKL